MKPCTASQQVRHLPGRGEARQPGASVAWRAAMHVVKYGNPVNMGTCGPKHYEEDFLPTGAALGILPHFQHTSAAPPGNKSSSLCGRAHNEWNKIEHRMFSHITQNWRGRPLVCREVVVNLIGAVTTQQGLRIQSELDENSYESGRKVTDEEMEQLSIERADFHGEWNYTLVPRE